MTFEIFCICTYVKNFVRGACAQYLTFATKQIKQKLQKKQIYFEMMSEVPRKRVQTVKTEEQKRIRLDKRNYQDRARRRAETDEHKKIRLAKRRERER